MTNPDPAEDGRHASLLRATAHLFLAVPSRMLSPDGEMSRLVSAVLDLAAHPMSDEARAVAWSALVIDPDDREALQRLMHGHLR